ncbi:MAG: hypothetical protein JNM61_10020 [Zoogloeaceae bacterium]|nr:hypothetical protein [Zoogloeaceae bacterium]
MPNQYGGDEFGPKRAMAYRFRNEAGRVSYLGNVDLRMTEQDMYDIIVENGAKRDLTLLAKKLPSVTPRTSFSGPANYDHETRWVPLPGQDLEGRAQ